MGKGKGVLTMAACLMASHMAVAGNRVIKLEASAAPPHQISINGQLAGRAVDVLTCAFNALNRPFDIHQVPWLRAQFDVKNGSADGFFSAVRDPQADEFAVLSAPIGLEKWYWVGKQSELLFSGEFPAAARIGAVSGSSQSAWLSQHGVSVVELVSEPEQLAALLESRRIDAYLSSLELVARQQGTGRTEQDVSLRFAQYAPLGVYFSRQFLNANPGFLERFNGKLGDCQPDISPLATNERSKLKLMLDVLVQPWLGSNEVMQALAQSNSEHRDLTVEKIIAMDARWQSEVVSGEHVMSARMLQNPLSQYLKIVRERQHELITEIIVMDARGVNVGISDLTSDYWQGDEDKFQRASVLTSGVYLSDIMFDASTQKFQVQASFPLREKGALVGVVTVGIDIEKALLMD